MRGKPFKAGHVTARSSVALSVLPGVGAHEKGGVEGDLGWFRHSHLSQTPAIDKDVELNDQIDRWVPSSMTTAGSARRPTQSGATSPSRHCG